MRKTYKFSHSVFQGGFLYAHKMPGNKKIENKDRLRNVLEEITTKFELLDATIKIYDSIFFLFFMHRPATKSTEIINAIQESIKPFGSWHQDYMYTTVYDLQEKYVRKDLEKLGFDYDKG